MAAVSVCVSTPLASNRLRSLTINSSTHFVVPSRRRCLVLDEEEVEVEAVEEEEEVECKDFHDTFYF